MIRLYIDDSISLKYKQTIYLLCPMVQLLKLSGQKICHKSPYHSEILCLLQTSIYILNIHNTHVIANLQ